MKLNRMKVLSDEEIRMIHEASIDILKDCGVKVYNKRMLSFLREKGLRVDNENQIVFFTKTIIEDSLGSIPITFEVYDREGNFSFIMGDGISRIAAGHNAIFWVDSETGKTRYSIIADVELFSRICEKLECIDVIGIPVMPQDVEEPSSSLLYGVKAVIENSKKPVFFSTDNERVNNAVLGLLEAAFNGDLKNQVYGISQFSPTSPLYWEGHVIEAIMDMIETGVPIAVLPEPNAGISAPYTLAGLLTVNNAECLSGLSMIQLLEPGTKVMYANSWTVTDMRNGAALVGSTETTICRVAGAQLGKFYGVPTHTTAPNSDNHTHDEQNSWEKTFSMFCSVASGNDLIVNCGMFATGMACSNEQLIMDEEISVMSKRIVRGIDVNEETIAAEMVKGIGPGPAGDKYLTASHTIKRLRSDEYITPRVSVRGPLATWEAGGSKDTYQLARDKVREFNRLKAVPMDFERMRKLDEIVKGFK